MSLPAYAHCQDNCTPGCSRWLRFEVTERLGDRLILSNNVENQAAFGVAEGAHRGEVVIRAIFALQTDVERVGVDRGAIVTSAHENTPAVPAILSGLKNLGMGGIKRMQR